MGYFSAKALILAASLTTSATIGVVAYDGSETLNAIKGKISAQTGEVVKYEANQNALINKVKNLQTEANLKIGQANAKIIAQKGTIALLKGEVLTLRNDITGLKTTIAKKDLEIAGLTKSLEEVGNNFRALEKKYNDLVASNNATLEELEKAKADLVTAAQKAAELQADIERLNGELATANAQLQETTDKLTDTENQLIEANTNYEKAVAERNALQEKLDVAIEKAKDDAAQIEGLNQSIEDLKLEGDDEIYKANDEILKAEDVINDANGELEKANEAQEAANAEVDKANEDVEKFGEDVNGILDKTNGMKAKDITDTLNLKLDSVLIFPLSDEEADADSEDVVAE